MGDLMDVDDDFGDIYADVECQASSSMNFTSCIDAEPQEKTGLKGGDCDFGSNVEQVKDKDEDIPELLNSVCGKSSNSDDCMSDSEDDFNIVLNDEDCKGISVAVDGNGNRDYPEEGEGDDEFLCVRKGFGNNGLNPGNYGGERGSELNHSNKYQVYESFGMASSSSQSLRGHWEDYRCQQHKVLNAGQLTSIQSSTNSAISYGGYGFALPWYRTILDVNIDAFEEKRWMHPGVDISDFFNFGFDEYSWKKYCISLEQLRQQLYMQNRFHNYDFSHLSQACEIRPGSGRAHEGIVQAASSSKVADGGEKLLGLPKGRAIQVEDGTGERPSKMDVSCPRVWDSDVVIQINVQDPDEDCCASSEDKLHHSDNEGIGSSTVTNLNVDDVKDVHDFDGSSADESLKDSRIPPPVSESNELNLSPDNPDNHRNANAQTSEEVAIATETVVKAEQENGGTVCKSDEHLAEIEVSGGERSHFSLTLSCSESESEASQDSVYKLPEASDRILSRQSSGAKLLELDSPDCKSPRRNDVVKKQDDDRHSSGCRSPVWEGRRYQKRRLHKMERKCDFGNNNKHNFSSDQGREFSGRYCGEKFAKIHSRDLHIKNPCFRNDQSLRNEAESQQRRNWIEDNFHERRTYDKYGLDEDWDSGERVSSPRDMISFSYGQSRRLFSKYKDLKGSNTQWRGKRGRIEPGEEANDDMFFLDYHNMDYDMPHKFGRPIPFNQEKDCFNEGYKKFLPSVGREAYAYHSERRDRYHCSPPLNLDSPWSTEFEDEHWDHNSQKISFWHYRESYGANTGRLRNKMSPRSDICDAGLDEKYGKHRPELGREYRGYHWAENYNDFDDDVEGGIVYSNDQAHRRWRKYSWKSRILHQVECESILSQHDNVSYVQRSSGSYGKSFRHDKFQSNTSYGNRKPIMTCRGVHDRTTWRYTNPVDLICGEGKFSGRRPHFGSLRGNHNLIPKDQKFVKEQKVPWDSKGFQTKIPDGGKDNKFPVTQRNRDMDVKGSQIVPEEQIKEGRNENKTASENAVFKQSTKKRIHSENVQTGNAIDKGYDEQQILDSLAKMERRRKRFQNPVSSKKELDSTPNPQFDSMADSVEVENKQERPARKRRWVG